MYKYRAKCTAFTNQQLLTLRHLRRDLSAAEWTELQAMKERGSRGMCSQEDLKRWRQLEPVQAHATMVYNEKTKRDRWVWRTEFCPGSGSWYESGPTKNLTHYTAELQAHYFSRAMFVFKNGEGK